MAYNYIFLYIINEKKLGIPHCREEMLDGASTQIWNLGGMTEGKYQFDIGTHCERCFEISNKKRASWD